MRRWMHHWSIIFIVTTQLIRTLIMLRDVTLFPEFEWPVPEQLNWSNSPAPRTPPDHNYHNDLLGSSRTFSHAPRDQCHRDLIDPPPGQGQGQNNKLFLTGGAHGEVHYLSSVVYVVRERNNRENIFSIFFDIDYSWLFVYQHKPNHWRKNKEYIIMMVI